MLRGDTWAVENAGPGGLMFSVGERGLEELAFNGQSLLASPRQGDLQPAKSLLRDIVDSFLSNASPTPVTRAAERDAVELNYSWGIIRCRYDKEGENKLRLRIEAVNNSNDRVDDVTLSLAELTFPGEPKGGTLEAGPFGYGFRGTLAPLAEQPQAVDPHFSLPVVRIDYGSAALNFCADDLETIVGVSHPRNPPERTRYAFEATLRDIKPHQTKRFEISFRFGAGGASVEELSGDLIANYRKRYPFQLTWADHRPIGAILLASSGVDQRTNPRRWIMNSGKIDITTEVGKRDFRRALLGLAKESVKVLKDINAQGMITWDIEGQETSSACFYGDPRLTATLAPEMDFKGDGKTTTADAYFKTFRAAGLRVGVCIRPQQIKLDNGKPSQTRVDDEHAVAVLKEKIEYARRRWGCTLFYIDSTMTGIRPYKPEVFEALGKAFPDVLLIPEEESLRYFAYSAPLNFYSERRVMTTPAGARSVYPRAFSVLMAPAGDRPEDRASLLAAVQQGDILLGNGWYSNEGLRRIKNLYQEAGRQRVDSESRAMSEPRQRASDKYD